MENKSKWRKLKFIAKGSHASFAHYISKLSHEGGTVEENFGRNDIEFLD